MDQLIFFFIDLQINIHTESVLMVFQGLYECDAKTGGVSNALKAIIAFCAERKWLWFDVFFCSF